MRHQLNSLDKIFKDRVGGEKTEAIQRMDKKIIQERMAIAEEIRKTEVIFLFPLKEVFAEVEIDLSIDHNNLEVAIDHNNLELAWAIE